MGDPSPALMFIGALILTTAVLCVNPYASWKRWLGTLCLTLIGGAAGVGVLFGLAYWNSDVLAAIFDPKADPVLTRLSIASYGWMVGLTAVVFYLTRSYTNEVDDPDTSSQTP
jgi:hypothetical protein